MPDSPPYPDADDDIVGTDRETTTGAPTWVKVFGIIALALILLVVILLLMGGHGPGNHTGLGGRTGSFSVT